MIALGDKRWSASKVIILISVLVKKQIARNYVCKSYLKIKIDIFYPLKYHIT